MRQYAPGQWGIKIPGCEQAILLCSEEASLLRLCRPMGRWKHAGRNMSGPNRLDFR